MTKNIKKRIQQVWNKFRVCRPYFFSLGDEMRQRLLLILSEAGSDGIDVAGITSKMHLSRPAVSYHLKILKDNGLITSRKRGTQVYYFIYLRSALDQLKDLLNSIEDVASDVDMENIREKAPWMLGTAAF